MGSIAPESTDSSSMGSVAQPDATVAAPGTTESKTPIGASAVNPLVPAPIGSTAAALDSGTRAPPFAGSSSSAASPATATSSGSGTATDRTSSSGATPNAALLPFIPPGSAFGDALYPYAVEQADTMFPSVLSCRAAPSLQAKLPGKKTPIDTSPVYVKGDPFGKTVYQDSETGPRKPDRDKKDVEPVETALDEVTKHVVETGLGEEHRGLEYLEKYLTTGEVETLHLRSKAPTPQFIEVKKSKRGGRKFGPQPGEATIPRIGINGFGRIGSLVARLILHRNDMQMQLVAVNDPFVSAADMTISLKDMPPGLFPGIKVLDIAEPEQIPWAKVGGDYIVESTGIYTDMGTASAHLKGGAKKVVICALSIDARTFVYGVNENTYTPDIDIISIADSATICIALLAKTLNTAFGITDCHALSSIFPDLVGKFHVIVHPDPHVKLSCVEMTVKLDKCVDYEMIKNSVRMESAVKELRTLLANLEGGVALKATDYLGDCRSCFFDADAGVTLGAVPSSSSHGSTTSAATGKIYHHTDSRCTDMILHMAQAPLLPGLRDDLAIACLIRLRVSPKKLFILRTVSRRWKRLLTADYYNSLRKKLGFTE
ncbi:hypothetical protein ACQ4PT_051689 [Festuca glaucescens]